LQDFRGGRRELNKSTFSGRMIFSMKTYTLNETAKLLNLPPRTIKQWEKEFQSIFQIPRTKQGARIVTDQELEFLKTVQRLYNENKSKRDILNYFAEAEQHPVPSQVRTCSTPNLQTIVYEGEIVDAYSPNSSTNHEAKNLDLVKEIDKKMTERLNDAMETISAILAESQSAVFEKVEELKKEAMSELRKTTTHIEQNQVDVHELLESTARKIETVVETLEEGQQLLVDQLERERQIHHEKIMERERAFRELVLQFREAAASGEKKEKKWWRIWEWGK